MNSLKLVSWCVALCGILLLGSSCREQTPASAKAESVKKAAQKSIALKRILVVHSYHPDYPWVEAVNRGIQMSIPTKRAKVEYFYMDTKRNTSLEWKQQSGLEALKVIDEWQPDVVVTVDDNAQDYVGRYLAGRNNPAVVFCGVNAKPEKYGYPAANVAGVLEHPHFTRTLELTQRILPDAQRVLVLSDYSPTSRGTFDYMKTQSSAGMEVVGWEMPKTFSQWKQTVQAASEKADLIAVYTYHTVQPDQSTGKSVAPEEVMQWTTENSTVPVIGFLSFAVNDGSLCGVLESAVEQGCLASELVTKVLSGKRPSQLEYLQGIKGQSMINLDRAGKLGIQVDSAIQESIDVVIFQAEKATP